MFEINLNTVKTFSTVYGSRVEGILVVYPGERRVRETLSFPADGRAPRLVCHVDENDAPVAIEVVADFGPPKEHNVASDPQAEKLFNRIVRRLYFIGQQAVSASRQERRANSHHEDCFPVESVFDDMVEEIREQDLVPA